MVVGLINVILIGMLVANFSYYSTQLDVIVYCAAHVLADCFDRSGSGCSFICGRSSMQWNTPRLRVGLRNAALMFFAESVFQSGFAVSVRRYPPIEHAVACALDADDERDFGVHRQRCRSGSAGGCARKKYQTFR